MTQIAATPQGKRLVPKVTCPNCWFIFPPEDIHFIAERTDTIGDPVLGPDDFIRFSPMRFTLKGEAIGPKDVLSSKYACPRCHLQVPAALLELPPLFVSLVGSPASGKSYFLTTMTSKLREFLPRTCLEFSDAEPELNFAIKQYEETLFRNPVPNQPTEIRKTQVDDKQLHRVVTLNGAPMRFPLPLQFRVWPTPNHPNYSQAHRIGRVLVLYDNAGEDFLPGAGEAESAAIKHLACSDVIIVLFDPTQDPRLTRLCLSNDPQLAHGLRPTGESPRLVSQTTLLNEVANRTRRYMGVSYTERFAKPLLVVLPKFDILGGVSGVSLDLDEEPYLAPDKEQGVRLNVAKVEEVSNTIRALLQRDCPDFVSTVENLSSLVRYIPVSSFGRSPVLVNTGQKPFYGICPCDIKPKWVTVPLMYCFTKWAGHLMAGKT
jgi:hypothetical protein